MRPHLSSLRDSGVYRSFTTGLRPWLQPAVASRLSKKGAGAAISNLQFQISNFANPNPALPPLRLFPSIIGTKPTGNCGDLLRGQR